MAQGWVHRELEECTVSGGPVSGRRAQGDRGPRGTCYFRDRLLVHLGPGLGFYFRC